MLFCLVQSSVTLVQIYRFTGLNSPCKWFIGVGICNAAIIFMVDSNLQRENILPSERAAAYKMKMEALKRQGLRTDLTSAQLAPKLTTEKIGEEAGVSKDTVKRFIRLTELQPELQQMVDCKYRRQWVLPQKSAIPLANRRKI